MTALTDATRRATDWFGLFEAALRRGDAAGAADLFDDECFWRDLVSFTWNIRTEESREAIHDMLAARLPDVQPTQFRLEGAATEADGVVEAWFHFETAVGRGSGLLRLKATARGDRAWTLLTTLDELKGHEEKKGPRRIQGAEHGVHRGRLNWAEKRAQEQARLFQSSPAVA